MGLTTVEHDPVLNAAIAEVSAIFARRSGRTTFAQKTVREVFETGSGLNRLILSRRPVSNVALVTEDAIALTASDYELFGRQLVRKGASGGWRFWAAAQIEVTYTGGYALPDECPPDLSAAAKRAVRARFYARLRDPAIKLVEVPDVLKEEYWVGAVPGGDPDGFQPDIAGVLTHYRYA